METGILSNTLIDYKSPPKEEIVSEKLEFLKRFWAGFHNSVIIALLFTLLGVGIGVKACKDFFTSKLDDVVTTGAMLHKAKVYTIAPKI
jgi:hypothetical protein